MTNDGYRSMCPPKIIENTYSHTQIVTMPTTVLCGMATAVRENDRTDTEHVRYLPPDPMPPSRHERRKRAKLLRKATRARR